MPIRPGLQLRVIIGPGTGELTPLNQERLMVGRSRNPGDRAAGWVFVDDKAVSRQHAELTWDEVNNTFLLVHRSETNMTWVNGRAVEQQLIGIGDQIKVGRVVLELEVADSMTPPLSPTVVLERPAHLATVAPSSLVLPSQRIRDELQLVVNGEQAINLEGLFLTVGRGNVQYSKDAPRLLEQMIELPEATLVPNHVILDWQELEGGFALFKNPAAPPVLVRRLGDNLLWQAWLTDEGSYLRVGDSLTFGDTTLTLTRKSGLSG